jgi:hypothetical protein
MQRPVEIDQRRQHARQRFEYNSGHRGDSRREAAISPDFNSRMFAHFML